MRPAYRISIFILCLALAAGSLAITSFAAVSQPPTINTPLVMPDLYVNDDGTYITYQFAISAYYNSTRAELFICKGKFLSGSSLTFRAVDYNYTYILGTTQPIEGSFECYNLLNGALISSGPSYIWNDYRIGITGSQTGFPSANNIAQYTYLPEGITRSNYNYNGVNEFVNFSQAAPDPIVYRSFTSEPKEDPLNKYVILTGEDGSYLYWINIRSRDFEALTYSWDIETDDQNISDFVNYNEYIKAESFFTPRLTFNANGSSILSLEADQQLLDYYLNQIPSGQSTPLGYIAFDVLITKYDLETGQYIDSVFRSDFRSESWTITIDATNFFGKASDYDSICVYGLQYLNQSNAILNRASIVWGVDPSFENWKSDISNLISAIFSAVDQMSDDVDAIKSDSAIIVQYLFDLLYDNTEGNNISEIRHNDFVFRSWMYKNFPSGTSSDFYDTYNTDYFSAVYELIRDNLGAEPVEYTTESNAFNNAAEDYSNAEAAVMPNGDDAASELNSALSGAGADSVLGSNGAYGFIRDTINDILFTNTKLTSFVVFALGMGVVVLVLGRKIHV